MIRFNNDYNHGAHPRILEALARENSEAFGGYGLDPWCEKAAESIKRHLDCPQAAVHFLTGATQANYIVIAAALRPFESVISADSGHINVHETGAVENCGHKIQTLPATDGKITAAQIAAEAELFCQSGVQEHITQPKMVYLSFPTEYGTIYSKQELTEIRAVCDRYGLFLFIDGARMAYGLSAPQNDMELKDFARLTDAFYCGGTKCGALFGEALVLINPALQQHFRSYMKQNGAMLAKGWLLGLQFYTLFEDGLYFVIAGQAVAHAMRIKEAFAEKGIPAFIESFTNQQFVVLDQKQMDKLAQKYIFEMERQIDDTHACVRFCTSWSTKTDEVDALVEDIKAL